MAAGPQAQQPAGAAAALALRLAAPWAEGTCGGPCHSPGVVGTRQTPQQSDPSPLRGHEPSAPAEPVLQMEVGSTLAPLCRERGDPPQGLPSRNRLRQTGVRYRNQIPTHGMGG